MWFLSTAISGIVSFCWRFFHVEKLCFESINFNGKRKSVVKSVFDVNFRPSFIWLTKFEPTRTSSKPSNSFLLPEPQHQRNEANRKVCDPCHIHSKHFNTHKCTLHALLSKRNSFKILWTESPRRQIAVLSESRRWLFDANSWHTLLLRRFLRSTREWRLLSRLFAIL